MNTSQLKIMIVLPVAAASLWCAPLHASGDSTLLSVARESLLTKAIYSRPGRIVSDVAPSGAVSVNRAWEEGHKDSWFIESQRYGGDLVQAGIGSGSDEVVQDGLRILDWGFSKQAEDGAFPGTGDPFHSTSLFVEAAARACLLLKQSDHAEYDHHAARYVPKLRAAAHWLMAPAVTSRGQKNNMPYTHRRWILAAALGETAAVCGDEELSREAMRYAREGCAMQTAAGINPEKGGEDASYQGLGLLMAARYYSICKDGPTRAAIQHMLEQGLKWEMSKIDAQGAIDLEGSTRTGQELGHTGSVKTIDYKAIMQAFLFGNKILGNPEYKEIAERIARERKWIR